MDEGPFRMPRSADRSASDRPAENRQPEEPRVVSEEPKPVHRPVSSRRSVKESRSKRPFILAGIAIAIVLLVVACWSLWPKGASGTTAIDENKYQAVFLSNGQVYFGKLHTFNNEYLKLTNIFYLQSQDTSSTTDKKNPQQTQSDNGSNNLTLVKLGEEIHGPQDEMIIAKNNLLFYENLKSDGKVSSTIKQYNDSHK